VIDPDRRVRLLGRILAARPEGDPGVWADAGLTDADPITRRDLQEKIRRQVVDEVTADLRGGGARAELPADRFDTLAQKLETAPEKPAWLVPDLHATGENTTIIGQPKVGKSTLADLLVAALVDEGQFLGRQVSFPEDAAIGYLNYEMTQAQLLDRFRRRGIAQSGRVYEMTLRGLNDSLAGNQELAEWCDKCGIRFLVIDALRRIFRGDSENEATQMNQLTEEIDAFKLAAKVPDVALVVHAGWNQPKRGRGSSNIDAWPDNLWSVYKENGGRYLSAVTRWGEVTPVRLAEAGGAAGEATTEVPRTAADHGLITVAENPDVTGSDAMRKKVRGVSPNERGNALKKAATFGYIKIDRSKQPHAFSVTQAGRDRLVELGWTE
jgi:hypothetical protein